MYGQTKNSADIHHFSELNVRVFLYNQNVNMVFPNVMCVQNN